MFEFVQQNNMRIKTSLNAHPKGFTLLEVMFGVFILAVALVGVLQGLAACMVLNIENSNLTIAANDAQHVLEQIDDLDYATCINQDFSGGCYTFPTFNNLPNETVSHTNVAVGSMRQVTVTISWMGRGEQKEYSVATFFSG